MGEVQSDNLQLLQRQQSWEIGPAKRQRNVCRVSLHLLVAVAAVG